MLLYSTNNSALKADLKEAVLKSLAPDKGLYMPEFIPTLPADFFQALPTLSFQEIAFEVAKTLFQGFIPEADLKTIIERSITFAAPVHMLDDRAGSLELWHGPSLAFKDFGARFMAALMSYFNQGNDKKLSILVATSGDTGGAVAFGFLDVPGIEVTILYPKGKVSLLQEKQLTTLGSNIKAIEIDGTFDDCQALVKEAFLDKELNAVYQLSSANSINIARLIPQSFYYFEAFKQLKSFGNEIVFAVPSGNFGNLTAGLIAKRMGLPVSKFIAATNINKIVPDYLVSGLYEPRISISTISNAMDVGNPSNFARMFDLYNGDVEAMKQDMIGYFVTDEETKTMLRDIYEKYQYVADPHGAVAYKALAFYLEGHTGAVGAFFETAHPSKFEDVVNDALGITVEIPERLAILASREKQATPMRADFADFKKHLLSIV
ncbi:MAG: threonine synthase [Saprospiraceae bacterium]|nr:threonine synthase [Saprospiraceae bacterium]